ncbi:type vi secretion system vgr family protein [Paraburkholderia caribensis MBA4]|uniref:Type vi secretion system vgr family protein n=1 Tax=Paraburkholderia caribensis MBA4 TaxID=1323664 RepID=A0A0P0RJK7_9BURK|nr:type VI secretion system Vgr family protein [Paraburkholderia caribensis]ALL68868.1 type vi secretion system vgr family protein [Paraburkholderia caribensis MBA4]
MQNYRRNLPSVYRKPERTLEITGSRLPRWTPPYIDMLPQGEDTRPVLIPMSLEGQETIGQPYRYVVQCRTDIEAPSYPDIITLDLDSIVGTDVTVSIDIPGKGTFIPGMPGDTGRGNIGFCVREISGMVTHARYVRHDDRAIVYEFVIEPALAKARKGCNYRIFQNRTVIEVIESILADYSMSIDWRISGPLVIDHYPTRDLIRQHFESDATCFQRLCEHYGLFYWFEHSNTYHRIVIADTMGAFHPHGEAYETIHFSTGDRIDEEHIDRLEVISTQTEGKVTVVDHDYTRPRLARNNFPLREDSEDPRNTAEADQEFYTYANVSQPLQGAQGLNGRKNDVDREAQFVALVRMQALRCKGLRAKGHGNMRGLMTGFTFELVEHPYRKANQEYLVVSTRLKITEVDQTSSPGQEFSCETSFEVQPVREYFRMPHETPWPQVGVERAIVTGPDGREMWTDSYGRICCQVVPDREGNFDHNSFIWVSPMQPWQHGQTGTAAVPRIGSEIYLGYVNGNPDMPVMLGSTVNASNQPGWQLPRNQWLSGLRSRMQGGVSSNHLALDDTKGKQQAQLASDHGKSSLSVGYNTRIDGNDGRQDARGEGFELRTDLWGVLRAAMGLLVTTVRRPGAAGKVKEMGETVVRLTQARAQHEDLSRLALQHNAQTLDASQAEAAGTIRAQNDAIRGDAGNGNDFPELTRPDMVFASAAGIATTATDNTHMASQNDHAVTAGRDVSYSAGRSYHAAATGAVSLFAYQQGMKFIAAKGAWVAQAQSGPMSLAALGDVTISSSNGEVIINAAKRILLVANGSYIELTGSGITNGSPGPILEKGASWNRPGADSKRMPLPVMPVAPLAQEPTSVYSQTFDVSTVAANLGVGPALANQPYRVYLADGTIQQQGMLTEGTTMTITTPESTRVKCEVGAGDWGAVEDSHDHHELEHDAGQA